MPMSRTLELGLERIAVIYPGTKPYIVILWVEAIPISEIPLSEKWGNGVFPQ